ncbi:MAG: 3-dehydroquinate dehydratase [Chitinophagaceae bacterium]|nr:3-dehydroquinate dehydratase [Chitinophagaceae bacterium]
MNIHIINGPNLNLLGTREIDIYGNQSFETYFKELQKQFPLVQITYFQSNVEGEIINELQRVGFITQGIVLNPAGYSHTSVAIADAVSAIQAPVVEVHISNIFAREEFRKHSFVSSKAKAVMSGFGLDGYRLAIDWLIQQAASL